MNTDRLIGLRVYCESLNQYGRIEYIDGVNVAVSFYNGIKKFKFPDAFAGNLQLEDEELQEEILHESEESDLNSFVTTYIGCLEKEISYIKSQGGKRHLGVDGQKVLTNNGKITYAFDLDEDLHLMDGALIKIFTSIGVINGTVLSIEDFSIVFQTNDEIPGKLDRIEFSADSWQFDEALICRLQEMSTVRDTLAYQVACQGKRHIHLMGRMAEGQDAAIDSSVNNPITFIWGPPGTGKTQTLAEIATEFISSKKRVLMISYSNVSVDEAVLRVADVAENEFEPGQVVRYGFPRKEELFENKNLYLNSYQYVLHNNPGLMAEYEQLLSEKKRCKNNSARLVEIKKKLTRIKNKLSDEEKELVQTALFVGTTVSKAIMDSAIYSQRFDLVLFDEASMAYVPQVVFAASLAKSHFCCLGDFNQLPAIVQSNDNPRLEQDIFEYTGITTAVYKNSSEKGKPEQACSHDWLVMLRLQHRTHIDIADFISEEMYLGKIETADDQKMKLEIAKTEPLYGRAMALMDLSGMYSACMKVADGSRINILSALICARMAQMIGKQYEVGIITPYSAQARLLLSMVRDIQARENECNITCATVHQFQGSEKAVIIYDAVDCFRQRYPGHLLTSMKNNTANRLFNVAVTRAQGKFILVCNRDFFERKHTSDKLLFSQLMELLDDNDDRLAGDEIISQIVTSELQENISKDNFTILNTEEHWEQYLRDINSAHRTIVICIPGQMEEDDYKLLQLVNALAAAKKRDVRISIFADSSLTLNERLEVFTEYKDYVVEPVTIIDRRVVWYGEPLTAADFITGGELITTEFSISIRFEGEITARSIRNFLEISKENTGQLTVRSEEEVTE